MNNANGAVRSLNLPTEDKMLENRQSVKEWRKESMILCKACVYMVTCFFPLPLDWIPAVICVRILMRSLQRWWRPVVQTVVPVKLHDFTSLNMNRWLYEMLTTKHKSSPEMSSVDLKARSAFHFSPCFINFTSTASLLPQRWRNVWLLSRIFPLKPVPCGCAGSICRARCNELVIYLFIFFTV